MSRKKRGFKATFTEDAPLQATANSDETFDASVQEAQETIRIYYNFGDGLLYDLDTNTLSVNIADAIEQGNNGLVTSDMVNNALADNGIVYSEDEHICGRFGDDLLYERMFEFNNTTIHYNRTQSFEHGIENVGEIFVTEAYLRDTSIGKANGNYVNAIGSLNISNLAIPLQWVADDTYIWINCDSYFLANANRTWRIVVRYTKIGS